MKPKVREKERAINLRKRGLSYSDILKEVNVSKSSLSLWLKDLPLTTEEKMFLKNRKDKNISRGRIKAATINRRNRQKREGLLREEAREQFKVFSKEPLFQVGVALYWAEGSKRNHGVQFINSDPEMISLFIRWVEKYFNISRQDLFFRLFIHKPYMDENCEEWWSEVVRVPSVLFKKTIYKPTNLLIKKRQGYKGCIRIGIPRSKSLLIKIKVWQNMLSRYYEK